MMLLQNHFVQNELRQFIFIIGVVVRHAGVLECGHAAGQSGHVPE